MYDGLIKMLRVCGDSNNSCANCPVLEDGSCPYGEWEFAAEKYMLEAADAIEELSKTIPHNCFCCVGCEIEPKDGRGCETGFVLSAHRARQYIEELSKRVMLAPIDSYAGLKRKYIVLKADTGEDVPDCFVLRPAKDKAAAEALRAYAKATDNDLLAADIYRWVGSLPQPPKEET